MSRVIEFAKKLGLQLLRIVSWPARAVERTTFDGAMFFALAVFCGFMSLGPGALGPGAWANIPLLISMVLVVLWITGMWQGTESLRRLNFRRTHSENVFAGEPLQITLHLSNISHLPVTGLTIGEELEPETAPQAAAVVTTAKSLRVAPPTTVSTPRSFVLAIAGKRIERVKYPLRIRRRGIYRFSRTHVETFFPFGFFRSFRRFIVRKAPDRVVVYPRLGEVNTAFFQELELAIHQMRHARPTRAEEDFRGLREYRKEDSAKWIHWKSSARTNKLVVREFEEPQSKRVLLVLDTNLQRLAGHRFASFEMAISFAGTLARDLARRGIEVEFVALQPENKVSRICVSRERRNLDALLEILAGLRRDDARTLGDLAPHIHRRSLHNVYVLVVGLGSLRVAPELNWLKSADNIVRVFDARGEDFRQVFHRAASSARDDNADEDVLLSLGDEEENEIESVA